MNNSLISALIGALSGGLISVLIMFIGFSGTTTDPGNPDLSGPQVDMDIDYDALTPQEALVIDAVKKADPAVVSIIITKEVPVVEQYYENYGNGPFSFQIPQYRQNGTEEQEIGGGSGFIVSEDGYIMTNSHVVDDEAADYTVFMSDGIDYSAEVIAKDSMNDIAVLKIDATELPYLEFGDSDALELGQSVIAIGNPLLEFNNSVSLGIVSGLSRSILAGDGYGKSEQLEGIIQTDAAINPGNSGGPLLNLEGEVIGVNVAVASAENIGFSLPGNLVERTFESVQEHGRIVRPYLGVRYLPVTMELKELNGLSVGYGALILRGETMEELAVVPGSPADKAGLEENDIILEIDGEMLEDGSELARIISKHEIGDTLTLKVLHEGEEIEVEVVLEESPE